jgi:hypothetical protein
MDNEPVTAKSLSWTYMIQDNTFARAYKDTLSDFPTWVKKENVDDGILIAKNLGPRLGIDESEFGHEVYTILHNKDAHGKKGAIVVFNRTPNHFWGHIAMYDGKQWVSDFKQKSMFVYKYNKGYSIFRIKSLNRNE